MQLSFYLAPWRLVSLYIGTGLLCIGADYYQMPDWDTGISFLMASLCYLTAPYGVWAIKNLKPGHIMLSLFLFLLTVDISYVLYNGILGREFYEFENFMASTPLYWMMGLIWFFGADTYSVLRGDAQS